MRSMSLTHAYSSDKQPCQYVGDKHATRQVAQRISLVLTAVSIILF